MKIDCLSRLYYFQGVGVESLILHQCTIECPFGGTETEGPQEPNSTRQRATERAFFIGDMEREWKAIPGCDGKYFVSRDGEVKSIARTKPRILSQLEHPHGYRSVLLGRRKRKYVHQLVLLAFVGPPPDGYNVDHINGIRDDNRLKNLRYLPIKQNSAQGGSKNQGQRHGNSKLTRHQVIQMRRRADEGEMHKDLAQEFGISANHATQIINRNVWTHVS